MKLISLIKSLAGKRKISFASKGTQFPLDRHSSESARRAKKALRYRVGIKEFLINLWQFFWGNFQSSIVTIYAVYVHSRIRTPITISSAARIFPNLWNANSHREFCPLSDPLKQLQLRARNLLEQVLFQRSLSMRTTRKRTLR